MENDTAFITIVKTTLEHNNNLEILHQDSWRENPTG